jgi:curli biogenesis system outer membrane secretion channel CsgG
MNTKKFDNKWLMLLFLMILIFDSGCMLRTGVKKSFNFKKIDRIAVLVFESSDNPKYGEMVTDLFTGKLIDEGCNIVERTELENILQEQKLSMSGVIDSGQIIQAGKLWGADAVIVGSVPECKPPAGNQGAEVTIKCRMIYVKTGQVVWTAYNSSTIGTNIQEAADETLSSIADNLVNVLKTVRGEEYEDGD